MKEHIKQEKIIPFNVNMALRLEGSKWFLMKYICDIEALFLANKSSDKDISYKCLTMFESYKN